MMNNPRTLRRKAAHLFGGAAASATPAEAAKLTEVGRQLELWADDLEEVATHQSKDASKASDPSTPGKKAHDEPTRS
jgi:hypothetical protein